MDPDAIFIILLYFIIAALTIVSIIGLTKKAWRSGFPIGVRLCLIGLMLAFIVFAVLKFDSVYGNHFFNVITITIGTASFLIGFNWTLNLSKKVYFKEIKIPAFVKITLLTIFSTVAILAAFFATGHFFDKLDLLGSCC